MKQWFKDNGGLFGVIVAVGAAVTVVAELRIRQHLDGMSIPSDDRIASLESDITEIRDRAKEDRDRFEDKIERIVDILLED